MQLTYIGREDSGCPYCGHQFEKRPERKTECKSCGNFVYSKKRPVDEKKVLLKEDDLETIEEQWSVKNGTHDQYIQMRDAANKEYNDAKKALGPGASENDIEWRILNGRRKDGLIQLLKGQIGVLRFTNLEMAKILISEECYKNAARYLIEICVLDCIDTKRTNDDQRQYAVATGNRYDENTFEHKFAPGIVRLINRCVKKGDVNTEYLQSETLRATGEFTRTMKVSLMGEYIWTKLYPMFEKNFTFA